MFIEELGATYGEIAPYTSPKNELGREAFLTLLVAQLKHQDPFNPMQSAEFTAQLAQFSSLEQLFNINDNLETLNDINNSQKPENLLDYIGKEIKSDANYFTLTNGRASGSSYTLGEGGDVLISIFNQEGLEIRTVSMSNQEAGEYDFSFDGKDNNGYPVPDGKYSFTLLAFDNAGSPIEVSTGLSGLVTAVTYQNGIPYLIVGDHLINPESITEVSLVQEAEAAL